MTLHPKPFLNAPGTAAHVHISVWSYDGEKLNVYQHFYAGILRHLRAIAAFTCSNVTSYERLQDGCWAGGRWVAWGTQNRETALRKIEGSHWEFKALDGLANPYLAMAAILSAGLGGILKKEELVWGDCEVDPANLTENDKMELGVEEMLPASLPEALEALRNDDELVGAMGRDLVERYIAVKEAEIALLKSMLPPERRSWIIERY
jgi:glutamine synthetase